MAAFSIATLSLIGIPPASGFVSKWYLALGTMERGDPWLLGVLLTSSLMNAAYLGPIVYKAYFEKPIDPEYHGDTPALAFAHDRHTATRAATRRSRGPGSAVDGRFR